MTLMKQNRTYFSIAKEISKLSDFSKVKIGCVAVYKHKIISTGFNSYKTSPLQKKYNKYRFDEDDSGVLHTYHAETSCLKPLIRRRDINFKNVNLYVYREYRDGTLAPSRPCESCMMLIRSLGIRHIYYTNNGSYVSEELVY